MHSNPLGPSEKNSFCGKVQRNRDMCDPQGNNPTLRNSQSLKKLICALSCTHKGPKCIQTLWDHPKKIPFVQKYEESAICAILREKNPILRHSQRLKKVLHVLRCAKNAPQRPQRMQIPRGFQKKSLLCRKSAILSIRWKFQF